MASSSSSLCGPPPAAAAACCCCCGCCCGCAAAAAAAPLPVLALGGPGRGVGTLTEAGGSRREAAAAAAAAAAARAAAPPAAFRRPPCRRSPCLRGRSGRDAGETRGDTRGEARGRRCARRRRLPAAERRRATRSATTTPAGWRATAAAAAPRQRQLVAYGRRGGAARSAKALAWCSHGRRREGADPGRGGCAARRRSAAPARRARPDRRLPSCMPAHRRRCRCCCRRLHPPLRLRRRGRAWRPRPFLPPTSRAAAPPPAPSAPLPHTRLANGSPGRRRRRLELQSRSGKLDAGDCLRVGRGCVAAPLAAGPCDGRRGCGEVPRWWSRLFHCLMVPVKLFFPLLEQVGDARLCPRDFGVAASVRRRRSARGAARDLGSPGPASR